jgi:hypothetical protein
VFVYVAYSDMPSSKKNNRTTSDISSLQKDFAILEKKVDSSLVKVINKMSHLGFREYVGYLNRPWKIFWMNFFAGIARGFGFFVGGTVVVTIVTLILSKILIHVPFVADFLVWFRAVMNASM